MSERTTQSYESSVSRLNTIVNEMESGNLGLAQSLERLKEADQLLSWCREQLKAAEQQLEEFGKNNMLGEAAPKSDN